MFRFAVVLSLMPAHAAPPACLDRAAPDQLFVRAEAILKEQKIEYRIIAADKLQISPSSKGHDLNRYADEVRSKFAAKVLVSPSDLVCGAGADTDPGDVCALSVNLGLQALVDGGASSTPVHELKHLEQVSPLTNSGFDSLFFGRISNLDGTDHSSYPSFALDEIPAYATELVWLNSHRAKLAPDAHAAYASSARTQLNQLLARARVVVERQLKFVRSLHGLAKPYSAVASDGDIAVVNLKQDDQPALLFKSGDWRGSGKVNMAAIIDGQDQLTLPLFDSILNLDKTTRLIGPTKNATWPLSPVAAEAQRLEHRLGALRKVLGEIQSAVAATDLPRLTRVLTAAERYRKLSPMRSPCRTPGPRTEVAPATSSG